MTDKTLPTSTAQPQNPPAANPQARNPQARDDARPSASPRQAQDAAPAAVDGTGRANVSTGASGKRRLGALDGVRALAIVAVLFYHANTAWLPGGFLGVTVFFALSGYLITGGIVEQLERTDAVRLKAFYAKRLRRLWPLMLVVVVAVALLTAVLATGLLQKMRPDVLPSLLFFDNIWYIVQDLSYFAAAGQPSPLTHFWYLGVIGQFYLVWPLMVWLMWKVVPSRTAVRRLAVVLMVASFALMLALYDPGADVSRVYYGTDTRFAELMVGAWLALAFPVKGRSAISRRLARSPLGKRFVADALGVVALAAIVVMAFVVTGSSPFLYRGGLLLTAVLVGVVISAVRNRHSLLGRVLAVKPLAYLSSRSYGLYLWHYPLFLIMNPATRTTALPWWGWIVEFAIIFAVAELTYRFVEKPTGSGQIGAVWARLRQHQTTVPKLFAHHAVLGSACSIALAAAVVVLAIGPVWDADLRAEALRTNPIYKFSQIDFGGRLQAMIDARNNQIFDESTGQTSLGVFLIGDSVPLDAEQQFYQTFPNGSMDAVIGRYASEGPEVYRAGLANGVKPEVVVFALGTNGPVDEAMIRENLDLVKDLPVFWVNNRMPDEWQDANNEVIARVVAEYPNAHLIDWFSASTGHDDWFWNDGTHTRPEGADAYIAMIQRAIVDQL